MIEAYRIFFFIVCFFPSFFFYSFSFVSAVVFFFFSVDEKAKCLLKGDGHLSDSGSPWES